MIPAKCFVVFRHAEISLLSNIVAFCSVPQPYNFVYLSVFLEVYVLFLFIEILKTLFPKELYNSLYHYNKIVNVDYKVAFGALVYERGLAAKLQFLFYEELSAGHSFVGLYLSFCVSTNYCGPWASGYYIPDPLGSDTNVFQILSTLYRI